MKKHLNTFIVVSLCILCFGTLFATTLFKPVRASINPSYTYSLNGKTIIKGQPALLYKGKYYAPMASLSNALGYDIVIQEDKAVITTPNPATKDTITMPKAVITAIDFAANRITVYPQGQANSAANQIDLFITPETRITDMSGKTQFDITNLNTDMVVQATYSSKMTKSIPPQAKAISIKIPITPIQPR